MHPPLRSWQAAFSRGIWGDYGCLQSDRPVGNDVGFDQETTGPDPQAVLCFSYVGKTKMEGAEVAKPRLGQTGMERPRLEETRLGRARLEGARVEGTRMGPRVMGFARR